MRVAVLFALGACSFQGRNPLAGDAGAIDGANVGGDGRGFDAIASADGGPDARPIDAAPGCDGAGDYTVCLTSQPTQPLTLFNIVINTDDCIGGEKVSPGANAPMLCVLSGTTVSVGGLVRGEGSLPLALLATGSLTIDQNATLDVSSSRANGPAAAANDPACVVANAAPDGGGGPGGAGGSFGSRGGNGGNGASNGASASSTVNPAFVRGGCKGGKGGNGMGTGGPGGDGGGAVYVLARGSLTIYGRIDASGGEGIAPGLNKDGGGAGGSGGMIALWAPAISSTGELFANGGGGAGGSEASMGTSGGISAGASFAGPGGNGGGNTGDGGAGAIGTQTGGNGTSGMKGGGGGGGGVGVIRVVSGQSLGGTLSPPQS